MVSDSRRGLNSCTWNLKADDKAEKTVAKGDYTFSFKVGKTSVIAPFQIL